MIDTDKIMRITKILLHGRHINKNEADDYLELITEVKRLRMIVARLEDARIELASVYDRPKLFDAVREIYEQRLQDIYQEKREEE
jgi:hypothetical protein